MSSFTVQGGIEQIISSLTKELNKFEEFEIKKNFEVNKVIINEGKTHEFEILSSNEFISDNCDFLVSTVNSSVLANIIKNSEKSSKI